MPTTADRATFRRAFEQHYDAIARYCLRRLPTQDAKDATAKAFTVAWRKIDVMPEGDSTLPWLYRIARYEVATIRRSLRRQGALRGKLNGLATELAPGVEAVVVQSARHREVLEAIATLSESDQEVILLRSFEDLSATALAAALDCSPDAARQRLSRALKRLRRAMGIADATKTQSTRAMREGGDR